MSQAFSELEASFYQNGIGKAANLSIGSLKDNKVSKDGLRLKTLLTEALRIERAAHAQAQEAT